MGIEGPPGYDGELGDEVSASLLLLLDHSGVYLLTGGGW